MPSIKQKNTIFSGQSNTLLWNSAISKKLLKDKATLTLSFNDILNQQNGYTRSFNNYIFTETYNQVLKRYCLVGLIWHINKI